MRLCGSTKIYEYPNKITSVPGAPGQAINMNADFVSLHAMKSETYTLHLPKNKNRVRDALTGKVLAEKVASYSFPVEAQSTYWFFLE